MHHALVTWRITIEGGPSVEVESRPAQGTRHEVLFGTLHGADEPVVVKLERVPGTLQREHQALQMLANRDGPAPRLLAAGTTIVDGERLSCLITERRFGEPPTTDDGWRRMGRAFARLGVAATSDHELPVLDHASFGRQHAQRAADLGDHLDPLAQSIPDWHALVSSEVPQPSPLVLTHGDPGPGNFLDDGHDGALIDWEEAQVAPRGLDLARLAFIALLGSGPAGYQARDHHAHARAVSSGYLKALSEPWHPTVRDARWWTACAGIQFVHRRWQRGGRPAPWQDAADILHKALAQDTTWGHG
jgi:aminoglycoside phosphotransferase (APT) family kinase protein